MLIMLYRPEKQAVAHYKYRFPFETHENCVKFHAELDLCQKRGLRRSTNLLVDSNVAHITLILHM